jgi:hypothetical protein
MVEYYISLFETAIPLGVGFKLTLRMKVTTAGKLIRIPYDKDDKYLGAIITGPGIDDNLNDVDGSIQGTTNLEVNKDEIVEYTINPDSHRLKFKWDILYRLHDLGEDYNFNPRILVEDVDNGQIEITNLILRKAAAFPPTSGWSGSEIGINVPLIVLDVLSPSLITENIIEVPEPANITLEVPVPDVAIFNVEAVPCEMVLEGLAPVIYTEKEIQVEPGIATAYAESPRYRRYYKAVYKNIVEVIRDTSSKYKNIVCIRPITAYYKNVVEVASLGLVKYKNTVLIHVVPDTNRLPTLKHYLNVVTIEAISTALYKNTVYIGSYRKRIELFGEVIPNQNEQSNAEFPDGTGFVLGGSLYVD